MEKCVRVEFNCQSLIMLKVIFLSLTRLNCMGILLRIIIDMRIFNLVKDMRTYLVLWWCIRKLWFSAAHITHNTPQSALSQRESKENTRHMHSIQYILRLAMDQAFSVGMKMHQCQTRTNKATASSHVLSLLVKNEECIETATSPL